MPAAASPRATRERLRLRVSTTSTSSSTSLMGYASDTATSRSEPPVRSTAPSTVCQDTIVSAAVASAASRTRRLRSPVLPGDGLRSRPAAAPSGKPRKPTSASEGNGVCTPSRSVYQLQTASPAAQLPDAAARAAHDPLVRPDVRTAASAAVEQAAAAANSCTRSEYAVWKPVPPTPDSRTTAETTARTAAATAATRVPARRVRGDDQPISDLRRRRRDRTYEESARGRRRTSSVRASHM